MININLHTFSAKKKSIKAAGNNIAERKGIKKSC
jgi:hypothetical protein